MSAETVGVVGNLYTLDFTAQGVHRSLINWAVKTLLFSLWHEMILIIFSFFLFTHQILNLTKNTTEIKVGLIISFLCVCSNLFCSVKDSVAGSQDPFMPNWFIHCNRDTQSQGMKGSCKQFNLNKAILAKRREKAEEEFFLHRFFVKNNQL